MVRFRRLCMTVGVLAALTVFTEPAWAQSSQVTYSLAGVETAATSTEGTFVGVAFSLTASECPTPAQAPGCLASR